MSSGGTFGAHAAAGCALRSGRCNGGFPGLERRSGSVWSGSRRGGGEARHRFTAPFSLGAFIAMTGGRGAAGFLRDYGRTGSETWGLRVKLTLDYSSRRALDAALVLDYL